MGATANSMGPWFLSNISYLNSFFLRPMMIRGTKRVPIYDVEQMKKCIVNKENES